jgi:N-acyl-D-amino-acid deacylase
MFDMLIRSGLVVDGTGAPGSIQDVAISDGIIVEVGNLGRVLAYETLEADGLLITPGFVDIHTHYDGQMTWDPLLEPSSFHGVTTVVAGNCGVGFAPMRPNGEDWLCGLMEGVEDIPGATLRAGIPWGWETFPEYLDVLDKLPHAIDVGTLVPHGAMRPYVMGERRGEPATAADIAEMARVVREALSAGALGFSTSRTTFHRTVDGENVPGTFAAEDELWGIASAIRDAGHGVFGWAMAGIMGEDLPGQKREVALMQRLSADIGCLVTFGLTQLDAAPELWREIIALSVAANGSGARLRPQVLSKPAVAHLGLRTTHPFEQRPTYLELSKLPLLERVARLRDPAVKERILSETPLIESHRSYRPDAMFRFADPPNYEPPVDQSIGAIAKAQGVAPLSALYDVLLERNGEELVFYAVANYHDGNGDVAKEMIESPQTLLGLSDGGAHVRAILDSGQPTYMLTHWVRDRSRGERLPLESVVRKQTSDTAQAFGLHDRGIVAPGMKADVNVIDFERLELGVPWVAADLPGGADRLMQSAVGYVASMVSGKVVRREGEDTGERPGRLIRGPQRPSLA